MKLLLTAIGKRIQLIKYLKKDFKIIGVDCSNLTPASYFVDEFYKVPKYHEGKYVDILLDICKTEKVDILIPLFENEFIILDKNRHKFKEVGTFLMLSDKSVLDICEDKWKTYQFFIENNISTPKSYLNTHDCTDNLPLFIKPRQGMGSKHSYKVNNIKELDFYFELIDNPIIQQYVKGTEFTIDCICDLEGNVVSAVPRERIEVRSGEVSKSRTALDFDIIEAVIDLCSKLKAIGPITIQCMKQNDGNIKFIEINPRFGGGVPLSFEAGVDYGQILKDIARGNDVKPIIGDFKELTMLRYDEAVFI
jgi:carbamoyl-phosphate synthase large subunit